MSDEAATNIAMVILILSIIGLGTVIKWVVHLMKWLFKQITTSLQKKKGTIISFPNSNEQERYYQSAYYQQTRTLYIDMVKDLGRYGEYLIFDSLRDYQNTGGKFLFNTYIPKNQRETTEIDVMLIHQSGIIVFESKNYSGWIFGNESSTYWMQMLYHKGRGRKPYKEQFYNPIKQNELHIKALHNLLGEDVPIYSIIVFSNHCELKEITIKTWDKVRVIKRNQLSMVVSSFMIQCGKRLEDEQIEELYQKLYPYTQVSEDVKRQHVEDIKSHFDNSPIE